MKKFKNITGANTLQVCKLIEQGLVKKEVIGNLTYLIPDRDPRMYELPVLKREKVMHIKRN